MSVKTALTKKTIIAACMALVCSVAFARNTASDFIIDSSGVITEYQGRDTAVVIPEKINGISVTAIGEAAFEEKLLTSVTIPRSVRSIGHFAFEGNQLTSVTIPDGVFQIGRGAFASNQLASVTIPGSVTYIGDFAFERNQLTSVTIPGNNVLICDGAFDGNPITSITLGSNHTLAEINIVPNINNEAVVSSFYFDYVCNDRRAGTYPTNRAVDEADIKKEADFEYIETQYGVYIYNYTGTDVKRLKIPARLGGLSVKAIFGFEEKGIRCVQIPDSVTYIDDNAFLGNQLIDVTIPDSVTYISVKAFEDNQLTSVTIGNGVISIGRKAFAGNRLTSVTIPGSVTFIGSEAFSNNKLTSVTISGSVTLIGWWAFAGNQLTSVTIGSNVEIDSKAFDGNFNDVYEANGKAAGTYTLERGNWTKQ
ncbi:MAG: leucine-rich repeat domain-containing protein [Treponema sp.]|nr:leucine-rich repeat domain-containing protein [Treponema sp.]